MSKDWKGGSASTFKTIGASNHTDHERGDADYYATEPAATDWLCKIEQRERHRQFEIERQRRRDNHMASIATRKALDFYHDILGIDKEE